MSNFPSVRPSLNLQFDSQPTPADMTSHLASVGATFSRASIGTYTDANGLIQEASAGQARPNYSTAGVHEGLLIEESRVNLIKSSEDFSANSYVFPASAIEITINQAIAPDGTASADLMESVLSGTRYMKQDFSVTSGSSYTISAFFKKSSTYDFVAIGFVDGDGTTYKYGIFNVSTGETAGENGNGTITSDIQDYGNGWYRCIITFTSGTSGTAQARFLPAEGTNDPSPDTAGFQTLIWGAQVEEGSFPTSYIPTIPTFSSRASDGTYFDSSGVLQTTSGERIDHKYIGGQWVEAGLLLEGASTNLIANSEDFSSGNWVVSSGGTGSNPIVTTNQVIAPDGNNTADKIVFDAGAGTTSSDQSFINDTISITSGVDYTGSIWLKGESGGEQIVFRHTAGAYDLLTLTTEWQRFDYTQTSATTSYTYSLGIRQNVSGHGVINSSATVYAWGAQLEEQSQVTSYIATSGSTATRSADVYTTATVTRSADVCTITGTAFTDFYNEDEGTIFVNAMCEADSGASRFMYSINNTISSERVVGLIDSSDAILELVVDNGVVKAQFTSPTITLGSFFKNGFRYNTNSFNQVTNGTASTPDTSGSVPTPTQLNIASSRTPNAFFNGYIKKFIYFPRALSDNELIKLTQ